MRRNRLSRLQSRMLAWLTAKEQRIRGTLSADYHALVLGDGSAKRISRPDEP